MYKLFKRRTKNQKGFTLVELIVVIAILGILAVIAVPRLVGSRDAAQLRADQATARSIMSAIAIAEATHGSSFTANQVQALVDNIVVDEIIAPATAGTVATTWYFTRNPLAIYKGTSATPIDLTATP